MLVTDFRVNGKVVEFGLLLPDGRRLPVDSKWTAVAELEALEAADESECEARARDVEKAVAGRAREVAQYLDPALTAPVAVAAVPDAAYAVLRRAHADAFERGVIVVPYSTALPVLLFLHSLVARYGDAGDTQAALREVATILGSMEGVLETSSRAPPRCSRTARTRCARSSARPAARSRGVARAWSRRSRRHPRWRRCARSPRRVPRPADAGRRHASVASFGRWTRSSCVGSSCGRRVGCATSSCARIRSRRRSSSTATTRRTPRISARSRATPSSGSPRRCGKRPVGPGRRAGLAPPRHGDPARDPEGMATAGRSSSAASPTPWTTGPSWPGARPESPRPVSTDASGSRAWATSSTSRRSGPTSSCAAASASAGSSA